MIALRPIYGRFGPMKVTVIEGRKIPVQILKLLDIKAMLKNGEIKEEKEDKKPVKKESKEDPEK